MEIIECRVFLCRPPNPFIYVFLGRANAGATHSPHVAPDFFEPTRADLS
jgi:hypothetical protein